LHANSKPALQTHARDRLSSLINLASLTTKKFYKIDTSGLYYKRITIVNYDSSIINKFDRASLTDNTRVVIHDGHMLIVQATVVNVIKLFFFIAHEEAK
jgi:hypothetical protein